VISSGTLVCLAFAWILVVASFFSSINTVFKWTSYLVTCRVRSQAALFSSRAVSPPPLFSVSGYSHPLTPVASASSTSSLVSCPFCSHRLTTLPSTTGRNPPDLFYDRRRENSQILIRLPPPPPAHPLALPAPPSFSPAPSPPNQNLQQGGNLRVGGGGGSGNRLLA
jgi:hypothetical protein